MDRESLTEQIGELPAEMRITLKHFLRNLFAVSRTFKQLPPAPTTRLLFQQSLHAGLSKSGLITERTNALQRRSVQQRYAATYEQRLINLALVLFEFCRRSGSGGVDNCIEQFEQESGHQGLLSHAGRSLGSAPRGRLRDLH